MDKFEYMLRNDGRLKTSPIKDQYSNTVSNNLADAANRRKKEEEERKKREAEERKRKQRLDAEAKAIETIANDNRDKRLLKQEEQAHSTNKSGGGMSFNQARPSNYTTPYRRWYEGDIAKKYQDYSSQLGQDVRDSVEYSKAAGLKDDEIKNSLIPQEDNTIEQRLEEIGSKLKPGRESWGQTMQEGWYEKEIQNLLSKETVRQMNGLPNKADVIQKFMQDHPELGISEDANIIDKGIRFLTEGAKQQVDSYSAAANNWESWAIAAAIVAGASMLAPVTGGGSLVVGGTLLGKAATGLGSLGALKLGMSYGSMKHMAELEMTDKYNQYIQEGVHPEIAKKQAATVGAVNGLIEFMQIDSAFSTIPGVANLLDNGKKLAGKEFTKQLTKVAANYGIDLLGNALEESAQEATGLMGLELSKYLENAPNPNTLEGLKVLAKTFDKEDYRERVIQSGMDALQSMWLSPIVSSGVRQGASMGVNSAITKSQSKKVNGYYTAEDRQSQEFNDAQKKMLLTDTEENQIDLMIKDYNESRDERTLAAMVTTEQVLDAIAQREDTTNQERELIQKSRDKINNIVSRAMYDAKDENSDIEYRPTNNADIERDILSPEFTGEIYTQGFNEYAIERYNDAKNAGVLDTIKEELLKGTSKAEIASKITKALPRKMRGPLDIATMINAVETVNNEVNAQKVMNNIHNYEQMKDYKPVNVEVDVKEDVKQEDIQEVTEQPTEEVLGATDVIAQVDTENATESLVEPTEDVYNPDDIADIESDVMNFLSEEERERVNNELIDRDIASGKIPTDDFRPLDDLEWEEYKKADVVMLPVNKIHTDANRFQFRYLGTTNKLEGAEFNQQLSPPLLVWQDEFGDLYVVNGHHRLNLAQESGTTEIQAEVYSHKDYTDTEIRALGAIMNIADNHAEAVDVAKVLRDSTLTEQKLKQYVSPRSKVMKEGIALSNLNDWIFTQVATSKIPQDIGVVIGNELPGDKAGQNQIIKAIDKLQVQGKDITTNILTEMIAEVKGTAQETFTEQTLFGEETFTKSVEYERATLVGYVKDQLRSKKSLLKSVTKDKNASMLESLGNKIAADENTEQLEQSELALLLLDKTLNYQGTKVNKLFNDLALEYSQAEPKDRAAIKRKALDELISLMEGGNLLGENATTKQRKSRQSIERSSEKSSDNGTRGQESSDGSSQTITEEQEQLIGQEALFALREQPQVEIIADDDVKNTRAYKATIKIVEALQKNVFFNGLKVNYSNKSGKIVFDSKKELKEHGYEHYEVGKTYYIYGAYDNRTRTITLNSEAARDTILEEAIHDIQYRIKEINPELGVTIQAWENEVRERAAELGYEIPGGYELLAQALVFSELGYASSNRQIAELIAVDDEIVTGMKAILGRDVLKEGKGLVESETAKKDRELKGMYENYAKRIFTQEGFIDNLMEAEENRKTEIRAELANARAATYYHPSNGQYVIVSPSTKGSKYQITYFDKLGPMSDGQYDTIDEVAEVLADRKFYYKANEIHYQLKKVDRSVADELYGIAISRGYRTDDNGNRNRVSFKLTDSQIVDTYHDARVGNFSAYDFDELIKDNKDISVRVKNDIIRGIFEAAKKGLDVDNSEVTFLQYLHRFHRLPIGKTLTEEDRITYKNGKINITQREYPAGLPATHKGTIDYNLGKFDTLEEAITEYKSWMDRDVSKTLQKDFPYLNAEQRWELEKSYFDFKNNIETYRHKGIKTNFDGQPHYAISYQLKEEILKDIEKVDTQEVYRDNFIATNGIEVLRNPSMDWLDETSTQRSNGEYLRTEDEEGNTYYWLGDESTREEVENSIDYRYDTRTEQNLNFDYKYRDDILKTPEFKNWFKDSKIVDSQGLPKVVYHGTRGGGFTEFISDFSHTGRKGIFFTNDIGTAETYSDSDMLINTNLELPDNLEEAQKMLEEYDLYIYTDDGDFRLDLANGSTMAIYDTFEELRENFKNDFVDALDDQPIAGIYPVYLSMQKPYIVEGQGSNWDDVMGFSTNDWVQEIYDSGLHDGIIFRNITDSASGYYDNESAVYVVFNPTQIKSIYNNGMFNEYDPNINYQLKESPKDNDIFYTKYNVEVIKNPTDRQYQEIYSESRKLYPELAREGYPFIRYTYDIQGNKYIWKSFDAVHSDVEPEINKRYNTVANQNRYFDYQLKESSPIVDVPGFYSNLENVINTKMGKRAKASDVMNMLTKNGVKPEELEWFEIAKFLEGKDFVYKDELIEHMANKSIEFTTEDMGNEFESYTLDGGNNYRFNAYVYKNNPGEPFINNAHFGSLENVIGHTRYKDRVGVNGEKVLLIEELQSDWHQKGRQEGYQTLLDANDIDIKFHEPNSEISNQFAAGRYGVWEVYKKGTNQLLVRFRDSKNLPGNIEQYALDLINKPEGMPQAPLKESITDFLIKTAIKDAVEGGYDYIAWTTGTQQADRYSMRKVIDQLEVLVNPSNNTYEVYAKKDGITQLHQEGLSEQELADTFGKEMANTIVNDAEPIISNFSDVNEPLQLKTYEGLELETGGEFHKKLYDNYVPRMLKKYGKKWGINLEEIALRNNIEDLEKYQNQLSFYTEHQLLREAREFGISTSRYEDALEKLQNTRTYEAELEYEELVNEEIELIKDEIVEAMVERDMQNILHQPSIPVTPQMIEDVMTQGQPLFQLKDVPKTNGDLLAIHNLSEANLKNVLKLGGIPMPSIAITKKDIEFTEFGDISLILNKDSVNPSNELNVVFAGDGWTPTFPDITRDNYVEDRLGNKQPATLENILSAMQGRGTVRNAQVSAGYTRFRVELVSELDSMESIKEKSAILTDEESSEEIYNDMYYEYHAIAKELNTIYDVGGFVYNNLMSIAKKYVNVLNSEGANLDTLIELLNEQNYNTDQELAQRIHNLIVGTTNLPVSYFEAKPQRIVGLDEIQAVIAPDTLSPETEQMLKDNGINLIEKYNPNEDRQQAIDRVLRQNDVSFQLKAADTNTKEFKNWFRDSKVVDEEGKPLRVYHGTPNTFDTFSYDYLGTTGTALGYGFYFAKDKNIAGMYTNNNGNIMETYLRINKPLNSRDITITKARLKKLIKALDPTGDDFLTNYGDASYEGYEKVINKALNNLLEYNNNDVDLISDIINSSGSDVAEFYQILADTLGYDGIITDTEGMGTVYIPFLPTQIKSVYNQGTWDVNDANIYYQLKEEADIKERSWGQTVRDAELTEQWLTDLLTSNKFMYEVKHNEDTLIAAAQLIDTKGEEYIEARLLSDLDNDAVLMAASQILTYKYMESGEQDRAMAMLDKTAEKATSLGQAIQILSVWGRQTPEGMLRYTSQAFRKLITDRDRQEIADKTKALTEEFNRLNRQAIKDIDLVGIVKQVQAMTPEEMAARDIANKGGTLPEGGFTPDMLKSFEKTIDDNMAKRIIDVVNKHYQDGTGKLKDKLGELGLNDFESEILDKYIKQQVKEVTRDSKQAAIDKGLKKQSYERKGIDEQILDAAAEGKVDENLLKNLVGEKEGMPVLNKELVDYIYQQGQYINSLPQGRQRDIETAKMIQTISDQMPVSFWTKVKTFQTIVQLLNFKTTIRNLVGNDMFRKLDTFTLNFLGTPIDIALAKATGHSRSMLFRPIKASQVQKLGYKEGWRLGLEDALLGINTSDLDTQYELKSTRVFKTGVLGEAEKLLNIALRATDRAAVMATFRDSLAEQMELAGVDTATEEMTENAMVIALYRTFQDDSTLSKMFSTLKKGMNYVGFGGKWNETKEFGLGDLVMKYPKTPANILGRAIDYSPVGLVVTALKLAADTSPKGSYLRQRIASEGISRAIMGSGLIALGAILANIGILTGSNPDDDEDIYKLEKQYGLRDFSVNVSALRRHIMSGFTDNKAGELKKGDTIASYDWAEPIAMGLAVGADTVLGSGEAMDFLSTVVRALETGATALADQPLLTGIANLFRGGNAVQGMTEVIKSMPSSFTPTLFSHVAQFIDGRDTDPYTFYGTGKQAWNLVQNRIPGLRGNIPSRYSVLGDEKRYYPEDQNLVTRALNIFLNPSITSKYMPTSEAQMIFDLYEDSGNPDIVPRKPQRSYKVDGVNYSFTPQSWAEMSKWLGSRYRDEIGYAMNTYMNGWSAEEQANEIEYIIKKVKEEAREKVKEIGQKID